MVQPRRWIGWAAAALVVWLVAPARGQVAPANDGGAPADAAVTEAGRADAASAPAPAASPAPAPVPPLTASPGPSELATPPELTSAQMTTTTSLIGVPTPAQVEEPRPITRRLWFWMAITGVIIVGSLVGLALYNPTTTRPDCPSGYVCPP